MIRRCFLTLVLVSLSLPRPVLAQINPFRNSSATPLNAEDITALTDATNRLLDRTQLAVGDTENWSNPKSGASGTVTAGEATERNGLACRMLDYQHTVPGPRPERAVTFTWCKTKDGWKVG